MSYRYRRYGRGSYVTYRRYRFTYLGFRILRAYAILVALFLVGLLCLLVGVVIIVKMLLTHTCRLIRKNTEKMEERSGWDNERPVGS